MDFGSIGEALDNPMFGPIIKTVLGMLVFTPSAASVDLDFNPANVG